MRLRVSPFRRSIACRSYSAACELKFVFHGGTNFDAAVDAHYHEGTLQIKDKDTIETSFVVFANGEISTDGRSVLKRAKKHSN